VRGLPAGSYLDATRAALESARIFAGSWQFVGHVADLPAPGTAARFDCAGRSAVVLRTRAGELRGFHNACRHRGTRLVDGDPYTGLAFCVDGHLRCPYHGWTYDETGALTRIPDAQRFAGFDAADHGLHGVEVAQWQGLIFVAFERPAQPLGDILASVAGDWPDLSPMRRLVEPSVTACAADWKLACEHLLDTAHVEIARPLLKPRLFEPAAFERRDGDALRASAGFATGGGDSWSARAYRQLISSRPPATAQAESVYLWPNLLLQLAPDGLAALQVLPGPTGHCTLRESRYATPDSGRESRQLRYLHQRVRRQARLADVRILARVQQSLANLAAAETWPVADSEAGVGWFVAHCADRCAGPADRRGPLTTRNRASRRSVPRPGA
jgi:phenylpropionate dioxygenase-like ring-hydroxylating dioxygenase large terminal subunit